ncbi:MAG: hypothetical protein U0002_10840 [Thermoanaerobaculia bacterium]
MSEKPQAPASAPERLTRLRSERVQDGGEPAQATALYPPAPKPVDLAKSPAHQRVLPGAKPEPAESGEEKKPRQEEEKP